jgi:hypothetical protein
VSGNLYGNIASFIHFVVRRIDFLSCLHAGCLSWKYVRQQS